jgi:hypothetical protein
MAAIDEDAHLDFVYFLMRRQPDLLLKLLPQSPASASVVGSLLMTRINILTILQKSENGKGVT